MAEYKNDYLLSKLSRNLEQLGFKKYGDGMVVKCFVKMKKCMYLFPKVKAKFPVTKNNFRTI